MPREAWMCLLFVAALGLVYVAWETVSMAMAPPLTFELDEPVDDDEPFYDEGLYGPDDPFSDGHHGGSDDDYYPHAIDALHGESTEEDATDSEEAPSSERTDAPTDEPPSADHAEGDVSDQIALLRERIRARAESERAQEEALAAAQAADSQTSDADELDPDAQLDEGAAWDRRPPEPWESFLRTWLGVLVLLLLALGLGFIARRTADRRYAFAALSLAVVGGELLVSVLLGQLVSPDAPWPLVSVAMRTTGHLTVLAMALLTLTAAGRGPRLAGLLIGVELGASVAMTRFPWSVLATVLFTASAALPYAVLGYLSAQQLRAAGARGAGGPYREAALSADTPLSPHSSRHAAIALGAWFAAQLLAGPIRAYDLMEASDLSSYLVTTDLALAIMATLQLRECRDQRERSAWLLTAGALWVLTLGSPFVVTPFRYAHGLQPTAVLLPLLLFGLTTAAMALLLAALRASTLARLTEDRERPRAPRPPEILGIGFGAIALRALSMSTSLDGVWVALALTAALGLAAFLRVTNRMRASLRRADAP